MSSNSKNDIAWTEIFEKYHILENIDKNDSYTITSSVINDFREARLMTKFDHKANLPEIFLQNKLTILPVTRGSYIISRMKTYHKFDTGIPPVSKVKYPNYLESIVQDGITSESAALNFAYAAGIIKDFTGDENLIPTVSGRMSSGSFNFKIDTISKPLKINIENSQIEIDGGYEGRNGLHLFEAKNALSDDFLVRQLYFPYRLWSGKIRKKVCPIFLTYSNGIYHLREYHFEEQLFYNSLKLIKEKRYAIDEGNIKRDLIQRLLFESKITDEPAIPFPQADSFERIINLCELLFQDEELNREQITTNYDFDKRQTNYYTDAGRYLGLIDKKRAEEQVIYFLTPAGNDLFRSSIKDRQIKFTESILSHVVFNRTLKWFFQHDKVPDKNTIVDIMMDSNLYHIDSDTTFQRRASTVKSWILWILGLINY